MKKIAILLLLLSCFTGAIAQKNSDLKMLHGIISVTDLQTGDFATWFTPTYENYKPDATIIEALKSKKEGYSVKIFMGTWCEDSQNNVPAFYKVLDQIKFNPEKITLIAVDRDKKTTEGLENNLNIFKVPTFIISLNGKEVNRIIESPKESFEKDVLKICSGEHYVPAYTN